MKVIDSVGWIAYLGGGPLADQYETHLSSYEGVVTPSIVVYEVYKHLLRELGEDAAALGAAQVTKTRTIPLSNALATASAEASCKHKLPMADAIIYATAQAEAATVVTSDEHLKGLPGVEYIPRKSE